MHFIAYGYLGFLASLGGKSIFPLLNGLGILVKNGLTIYEKGYFWALDSIPLADASVFRPGLRCCDYCCIVLSFKVT